MSLAASEKCNNHKKSNEKVMERKRGQEEAVYKWPPNHADIIRHIKDIRFSIRDIRNHFGSSITKWFGRIQGSKQ